MAGSMVSISETWGVSIGTTRVGLCQNSGRGHRGTGGDGERRNREFGRDDIQMLCWSCGGNFHQSCPVCMLSMLDAPEFQGLVLVSFR